MMYRIVVTLFSLVLFASVTIFGGTTGKIKGKIIDQQTGEPLIGATVVVRGTSLGAAADVNGEFIILNVPAGSYELEGKFLGYQPTTISNVRVSSDLTTELNFAMVALTEGVELSEIVVQRERELINKSATNAVRRQSGEDIENLPIRGVAAVIALSPGIVQQDGQLFIRGGRADEVGYYLEGSSTRNVYGRDLSASGAISAADLFGSDREENLTTVIPEALEEVQVQAGGYTAEYGGANAGIVSQTLKAGSSDYNASLRVETDNFTGQNEERLSTYSYGYSDYVVTLSGPLFSDQIKFFAAGENQFDRDWRSVFWPGFRFENLPDANADDISRTNGFPDTVSVLEVLPGNVPGLMRNQYKTNSTLTFDYSPIKVRLSGTFWWRKQQGRPDIIPHIFNLSRLPITEQSNFFLNTKLTHLISPEVYYEVKLSYTDDRSKRYDPTFGDDFLKYSDSLANAEVGYQFRSFTIGPGAANFGAGNPSGYSLYAFPFDRPGHPQTGFDKRTQTVWGMSVDLTAQVGSVHELKAGGSADFYTFRRYTIGSPSQLLTYYRSNPDEARTGGAFNELGGLSDRDFAVADNGIVNNYGYDWYGNEIDDAGNIDGPKIPRFYAAYLQDKIAYNDLYINAGIRLDVFDTDDIVFVDDPTTPYTDSNGNGQPDPGESGVEGPDNPSIDASNNFYLPSGIKKKPTFVQVSPRLGFSFPVSDRTKFYVQYGKFLQTPSLSAIYTGRRAQSVSFRGGNYIPTPAGFDVDPERTTTYEIGFAQQISDYASFDITGYYKDIKGQIQIARVTTVSGSDVSSYNTLVNGDFATTKGVELSLSLRRVNRVQAQINYTFADAKGTGSTLNSGVSSLENGTQFPTVISPLDFNNAHRGSINLDYRFGENDGGPILERLGANILFTFNSGHPFTLSTGGIGQQGPEQGGLIENDARGSQPLEAVNSSTTPWNFNIDLRLDKAASLGPLNANFFVYVQNLLNTKNVINVYRRTGNAEDDGFLTNPTLSAAIIAAPGRGENYVELYRAINLAHGTHYLIVMGNELFGPPRQIRFGMKLEL